jgi:membrane protein implicated in regulation of membrane protease activity
MLRKYWFMLFISAVLVVCVLALLEPSWERQAEKIVSIAFSGLLLWYFADRLERIERKLDAILKVR